MFSIRAGLCASLLTLVLCGCASDPAKQENMVRQDGAGTITLTDAPTVSFTVGDWQASNTSNPLLLTPDLLTNALLAVSRLQPGQSLLADGPDIPARLDTDTLKGLMSERVAAKGATSIRTHQMGRYQVVMADYQKSADGVLRQYREYAFILNGMVVHLLLVATPGRYYESGVHEAETLIQSLVAG